MQCNLGIPSRRRPRLQHTVSQLLLGQLPQSCSAVDRHLTCALGLPQVLGTPLRKMAAELRVPLPDPEPQPSATSPKGARLGSLTRQGSVARQPSVARRSATVGATRQGTLACQGSKSARSAGAAAAAAVAADGATAAAPPPLWWQHVADASFRAAAREITNAFFPASLTLRRTARLATDSGSVPPSPSAARALVSEPSRRSVAASEARVEEEDEEEEEEGLPPPHLRCPGAHMTPQQDEQVMRPHTHALIALPVTAARACACCSCRCLCTLLWFLLRSVGRHKGAQDPYPNFSQRLSKYHRLL